MSTFDRHIVEVPPHSRWHLLTGSIVLMGATFGTVWGVAWLLV